jgi:hypothetical protein
VSSIQAARAAATIERDFGVEVDIVDGRYGEMSVLVDEERVVSAGRLGFLGVVPRLSRIRAAVKNRLPSTSGADPAPRSTGGREPEEPAPDRSEG